MKLLTCHDGFKSYVWFWIFKEFLPFWDFLLNIVFHLFGFQKDSTK